ncbi:MAG: hypothetical protein Q9208_004635 [Pyrenodesmia sp. 3 TL-2023]
MAGRQEEATLDGPMPTLPNFLSLPPEIRNMIYEMALVCDRPLNLWPDRFVGEDASRGNMPRSWQWRFDGYSMRGTTCNCGRRWSNAAVEEEEMCCRYCKALWVPFHEDRSPELIAAYIKHKIWSTSWHRRRYQVLETWNHEDYSLKFFVRDQHDLVYIRKNLAAGLMRTCKLIHAETIPIFYGLNDFQFRGNGGWQGLLRFFLTIGSFARQQIKVVLVPIPVGVEWGSGYPNRGLPGKRHLPDHLDGRSKNDPKLRMVKIQPEGPEEHSTVRQVVEIVVRDKKIKSLGLYLPPECYLGYSYEVYHDGLEALRQTQGTLQCLTFCQITLVIGQGAFLGIKDPIRRTMSLEWDLWCEPGAYIRDPQDSSLARGISGIWEHRDYSYLEGIPTLFGADDEVFDSPVSTSDTWSCPVHILFATMGSNRR